MNELRSKPRRRLFVAAVALAVGGPVAAQPSTAAVETAQPASAVAERGGPLLAYSVPDGVVVVDGQAEELFRTGRRLGGFSLAGDLLTIVRLHGDTVRTVGLGTGDGARRLRIDDTLLTPTALRGGTAVAFAGAGERDRYATSLWLRDASGDERRLIRFSFGGSPGVHTGISEGTVLDYSFSRRATVVAVAAGDDIVNFDYDIWTVNVRSGERVRITRGLSSRYPALSPGGDRVAYVREDELCGGPMPGYRGGDLLTVAADGTDRRVVHDGDCERFLTRPRWLSPDVLAAVLHTRREGEDPQPLYDSHVVLVDVGQGLVSGPISATDRVGEMSVSPSTGHLAYTDWTVPEGFWIFRWRPGSGTPEDQEPWAQGATTHVPEGWAPHLRGDPTLIPSY